MVVIQLVVAGIVSILSLAATLFVGSENTSSVIFLSISVFLATYLGCKGFSSRCGILRLTFSLYFVLFYCFPGMLHASANLFPFYSKSYSESSISQASIAVFLFVIGVVFGDFVGVLSPASTAQRPIAFSPRFLRFSVISFLWAVMFLALTYLGIEPLLQARNNISSSLNETEGSSLVFLQVIRSLSILCVAASIHRWKFSQPSSLNAMMLLISFVGLLIFNFPLAISRFALFGNMLIIANLITDVSSIKFKSVLVFTIAVGMSTIFPLMSYLQRGDEKAGFQIDALNYFRTSGDLDGFQSTINVINLVNQNGISWGWHLLSDILFFIPRTVWVSKANPTGLDAAAAAGYDFVNISSPLPSELYVDFSLVGSLVGGVIFGLALMKLDNAFYYSPKRHYLRHYLIFGGLAGFQIIFLRGAIQGVIGSIATYFFVARIMTAKPFTISHKKRPEL